MRRLTPSLTILIVCLTASAVPALDCPHCGGALSAVTAVVRETPEYDLYGLEPGQLPGLTTLRYCTSCGWAGDDATAGDTPVPSAVADWLLANEPPDWTTVSIAVRAAALLESADGGDYDLGLAWLRAAWAARSAGDAALQEFAYERAYERFAAYVADHATGSRLPWARYLAGACAERLGRPGSALAHYRAAQYMGDLPALLRSLVNERLYRLEG